MLKLSSTFGSSSNESICFFMYKNLGVASSAQSLNIEAVANAKSWQINTYDSILKFFVQCTILMGNFLSYALASTPFIHSSPAVEPTPT